MGQWLEQMKRSGQWTASDLFGMCSFAVTEKPGAFKVASGRWCH